MGLESKGNTVLPAPSGIPGSCRDDGQKQKDRSLAVIQGPDDASRVQILERSLLYVLLSKSGDDGDCPGKGQGQDKEQGEGLQARRRVSGWSMWMVVPVLPGPTAI